MPAELSHIAGLWSFVTQKMVFYVMKRLSIPPVIGQYYGPSVRVE